MQRPRLSQRATTVLVLVVLTVLAGCSTSSLPGLGSDRPYETPLDATELEAGHDRALEQAGSATIRVSITTSESGETLTRSNSTTWTEFDTGPTYRVSNSSRGMTESYRRADGTGYARIEEGGNDTYDAFSGVNPSFLGYYNVSRVAERFEFTANGTVTIDDEMTYVYEATGENELPGYPGQTSIDRFRIRYYVQSNGLVKHVELVAGGEHDPTIRVTQTYTDLGETNVEKPDWLSEAKEKTTDS